jgi:1-acyl-sn-glycerol-3-phosphate acyltransferase
MLHQILNKPERLDAYKLDRFISYPRNGQPLITVSNHISLVDDPSGMSTLVPHSVRMSANKMRWGVCSEGECNTRGTFFATLASVGNTLPIQRGAGLYQQGMSAISDKLDQGEWVHLFPEGRIWQEFGKTKRTPDGRWCLPSTRCSAPWVKLGPFKWGVGKLIANAEVLPIVVPYFQYGLHNVVPQRGADDGIRDDAPRLGQDVTFKVGDPVEVLDLIKAYHHGAIQRAMGRQEEREAAAAAGAPQQPATDVAEKGPKGPGGAPLALSKGAWRFLTPERWMDPSGRVAFPNRVTPEGQFVPGHVEPPLRIRPPDHHLLTAEEAAAEEGHRLALYERITGRLWEAMATLEAEVREHRRGLGLGEMDDKQG